MARGGESLFSKMSRKNTEKNRDKNRKGGNKNSYELDDQESPMNYINLRDASSSINKSSSFVK